ncbi:MAG: hypothetical protein KY476_11700 [Planctomycetes bacterium]|nr:hypothetical protein [Planctomycetota bacterium]
MSEQSKPPVAERPNIFFRLTTFAGAVFVVTILAFVAAMFGDSAAPPTRFLDKHGGRLIGWEVAAILAFGLIAMAVDRRSIVKQMREQPVEPIEAEAEANEETRERSRA